MLLTRVVMMDITERRIRETLVSEVEKKTHTERKRLMFFVENILLCIFQFMNVNNNNNKCGRTCGC